MVRTSIDPAATIPAIRRVAPELAVAMEMMRERIVSDLSAAERKELPLLVDEAADAVESLISKGLEPTQAAFNR